MRACKKIRILLNAVLIIALVMPFRTQHEPAVVFRDLNYQFEIEENSLDVYTLRNCFRSASLIVEAECVGEATYGGNAVSLFRVLDVFAGDAESSETIYVSTEYNVGERCILFLADENKGEFSYGKIYVPVENGVMQSSGSTVRMSDGRNVQISSIKREIAAMKSELFIPNEYMFYSNMNELLVGCNEYFIGRVDSVSSYMPTLCRSGERGEMIRSERNSLRIGVTVLNSLGGGLRSGEKITITQVDNMHRNVINASTLKAVGGGDNAWELPVNGDVCLFFVIKSPDDKVNFFFPVNPYQGYVKIRSDGRLNSCSNMNPVITDNFTLLMFTSSFYK